MNTTLTGFFTLECVMKIFSFGFRVRRVTEESERRQQLGETTGGGEGGRENGLGVGVYVYLIFFSGNVNTKIFF